MQFKSIDQQVVVIMGASSGIGRATALRFAALGARVIVAARGEDGLASLVSEIESRGGTAKAVKADVSDPDAVEMVAEQAVLTYGRIDTWVHLSAVIVFSTFEETTVEEMKRIIDVNLLGQMYGARAALPRLRQQGRGAFISVSSGTGIVSLPLESTYSASKHGVVGFLDSLRLELMRAGAPIAVTNIMPSAVNTPIFNTALTRLGVKPRPIPPVYEPRVVVDAIVYAAEFPTRDIVVGASGMAIIAMKRLSPRLTDAFLLRAAFRTQMTSIEKEPSAPNNLFQPLGPAFDKVEGDFAAEALAGSLMTSLRTTGFARALSQVTGVVLDAAGTVAAWGYFGALRVLFPQSWRAIAPASTEGSSSSP